MGKVDKTIIVMIVVFILIACGIGFLIITFENVMQSKRVFDCEITLIKEEYKVYAEIEEYLDNKILCDNIECEQHFDEKIGKKNEKIDFINSLNCDYVEGGN